MSGRRPPSPTLSGRRLKRASATHNAKHARWNERTKVTCNGCGKVLWRGPRILMESPGYVRAVASARALHLRATGCSGEKPPSVVGTLPPDTPDGKVLEIMCSACGLIVLSLPVGEARANEQETQRRASEALVEHTKIADCSGKETPGVPPPRRKDPRCYYRSAPAHVPDCRCEREDVVEQGGFTMLPMSADAK